MRHNRDKRRQPQVLRRPGNATISFKPFLQIASIGSTTCRRPFGAQKQTWWLQLSKVGRKNAYISDTYTDDSPSAASRRPLRDIAVLGTLLRGSVETPGSRRNFWPGYPEQTATLPLAKSPKILSGAAVRSEGSGCSPFQIGGHPFVHSPQRTMLSKKDAFAPSTLEYVSQLLRCCFGPSISSKQNMRPLSAS